MQNVDYDMNYYLAAAYTQERTACGSQKGIRCHSGPEAGGEGRLFPAEVRRNWNWEITRVPKRILIKAISMDPKNYDRLIEIYEALAAHGYREVGQEYLQNVLDTAKQAGCL